LKQPSQPLLSSLPSPALYGSTIGLVILAAILRWGLNPWLGDQYPFITFFFAVLAAAWMGGYRPAMVATVLGTLTGWYLFLPTAISFAVPGVAYAIGLGLFVLVGSAVAAFGGSMRAAERRAREAERRLQLVTDSMSAPVTRCSRELRYVWVSSSYAKWLGRAPEEFIGQPIEDVLGQEAFAQIRPHIEAVLTGHEVHYEARVNFRGLGWRWIEACYTPTWNPKGELDGWVAVVTDIEERKRTEEALREADRQKNEFLATLAHELRNPLAPLQNSFELLRIAPEDATVRAQALTLMDRQLRQMVRLIDDLLDVSRISRNTLVLRKERVELTAIVQQSLEACRATMAAANQELHVEMPNEQLYLNADPVRLGQVFGNLLGNASKFTPEAGKITLTLTTEGKEALIRVRDTGIGIPPERLADVFNMFFQVDPSIVRSHGGLGIGLTIVKRLVEKHGGTVTVHSEGAGRGCEFTVRLPLTSPPPVSTTGNGSRISQPQTRRRVLVVDDNRDAAQSLSMLLRLGGHETCSAHSGPEALQAAESFRPELILLDLGLPQMSGYEVCQTLRRQPWSKEVVIVALTGWGQEEDRKRSQAAGFNAHLVKPIEHTALEAFLQDSHAKTK
jgi:PAS domain S-box-containing protein